MRPSLPPPGVRTSRERGVALLSVVLVAALLAVIAVGVFETLRISAHRSANADAMSQARWYARGAEAFAAVQIARLGQASNGANLAGVAPWNGQETSFALEDGGMRARVRDGGACFNLNEFGADPAEDEGARLGAARRRFLALLEALGAPQSAAIAAADALRDWIDGDSAPSGTGWEDAYYRAEGLGRLTAGTLLAEVSEARAIAAVTPDLYALARPYVCALPTSAAPRLNVNAMTVDQAPLLVMLSEGALSLAEARAVLARRPDSGWDSLEAFWSEPLLAKIAPQSPARSGAALQSRYFDLGVEVAHRGALVHTSATLEHVGGAQVRVRAHRWTSEE